MRRLLQSLMLITIVCDTITLQIQPIVKSPFKEAITAICNHERENCITKKVEHRQTRGRQLYSRRERKEIAKVRGHDRDAIRQPRTGAGYVTCGVNNRGDVTARCACALGHALRLLHFCFVTSSCSGTTLVTQNYFIP